MRSRSGCSMDSTRAPTKCLRSSMQNIGGWAGLSRRMFVNWMRGWFAPALSSSRKFPRSSKTIWSRAGCCTLSMRAPMS